MSKTISEKWHILSCEQAVKELKSDIEKGLCLDEVEKRQKTFGKNLLPQEKPLSKTKIFLSQFKSPLIYVLVIAGIVVFLFKEYGDAVVIFGAVFLNTVVGYVQENKAFQALAKLKKAIKVEAKVLRDGRIKIIDSEELVPGDIVFLEAGDKVPADGRIIESRYLETNEMALTGEWLAAEKKAEPLAEETPVAERDNMVYMSTGVESGKAKFIVSSTGLKSEIGLVAKMVKETKEGKTPLQKKLSRFSELIGGIIVLLCFVIFIEGILTGNSFIEMFTVAVAVAVAAIPEGLPVAMTVILALGMQRILVQKGLVRKLVAAETLGSVSIIATDKTKTLTEGEMKVSEVAAGSDILGKKSGKKDKNILFALEIASLANEAFIENPEDLMKKWIIHGRPTDKAFISAAIEAGINLRGLGKKFKVIAEFAFDPAKKYLAKAFLLDKKKILYVSGAPEKILEASKYIKIGNGKKALDKLILKRIKEKIEIMAEKGLRIVAVGYKDLPADADINKTAPVEPAQIENLVFVGLIALKDPVRKGVKEAINACRQAGIRPIIITGDHKLTAKAVAEEIGFNVREDNIMEGLELDQLSDKRFLEKVRDIDIYSRMEPRHKMRIISAWQERGEVIAMTGDGINDTPALKKADIGVALGSGAEAAKDVSDLILLTDNFNIIVAAVEGGRAIIDNIRKVITYLLTSSFTETIIVGATVVFGFPLPISPAQILWINLIEDGLPDIALAFEPKEKDLMKQKPKKAKASLLTKEMKVIIFIIGILTDLMLLGLFFWFWNNEYNISHIRTIIFAALSIDSLFYVFSCKSLRKNIWQINPFSNKFLVFAWIFSFAMLLAAIYLPFFHSFLKTVPLGLNDWLVILGLGIIELVLIEIAKWYFIVRKQTNV